MFMFEKRVWSSRSQNQVMSSWSVLGKSGAAVARVELRRGATVKAEPDALITMSQHVELGANMDAGVVAGMMRSALGGESLFSQTLTATADDQEVVLGAPDIGDVEIIRLTHDSPLLLQKGAYLASDASVQVGATTQQTAGGALFSGAGLFVLRASGQGSLAVSAHGSILKYQLHAGEERAVDNGHLVGWSERMPYEMRLASSGRNRGLFSSMFASTASGEGLMCFFRGPGTLWLQTHKPGEEAGGGGDGGNAGGGGRRGGNRRGGGGGGLLGLVFGSCAACMTALLIVAALIGMFVLVPAYGGRWEPSPKGGWSLRWDGDGPVRTGGGGGGGGGGGRRSGSGSGRATLSTSSTSSASSASRARHGGGATSPPPSHASRRRSSVHMDDEEYVAPYRKEDL